MARKPADDVEIKLYAQLGLRLPADLAMRLKRFCAGTGRSVNATVQDALVRYLDAEERRGKRA